jgi:hypothetical protein
VFLEREEAESFAFPKELALEGVLVGVRKGRDQFLERVEVVADPRGDGGEPVGFAGRSPGGKYDRGLRVGSVLG